jgi:hypothetical protein
VKSPRQAVATGMATTLVLVVVLVVLPGERALALDAWFLAIGALAVGATIRATVGRLPVEPPSPIDEPAAVRPDERPADLEELETAVQLGAESDFDLYFRLRPRLRRIAEAKLRARGLELDAPDGGGAEALGPAAWDLLRPDRPRPESTSRARNLPAIAAVADALERL